MLKPAILRWQLGVTAGVLTARGGGVDWLGQAVCLGAGWTGRGVVDRCV